MKDNLKIKEGSLFVVFKYVAVGSGVLGIGILIAIIGFIIASNNLH